MYPHRLLTSVVLLLVASAPLGAAASLDEALADDRRSAEDRARDAGRKPAQVIAFLGIEPGDDVIDLIAASGYYTEVLSLAVGEEGTVYAQNPPRVLRFWDGANDKALSARLAGGRLANVKRLDQELSQVEIEAGSLDAALTALNLHDIYHSEGEEGASKWLQEVYELLEPGGVLGIIDHVGNAGADNESLHRIQESTVKALVESSPFELEASSDLLRNPDDDHTKNVFDGTVRGKTDRFLYRLRKPE